jgi:hypothetical protein
MMALAIIGGCAIAVLSVIGIATIVHALDS